MGNMTLLGLLVELEERNVKVFLAGDKLRLEAPAGVLTPDMKEVLRQHKPALMSLFSGQPVEVLFWPGVKSKVYRARQTCLEAEGCLQLTREADCGLFPLTWCRGWCRERVSANDQRKSHGGLELVSSE
jgi:hypothetical protein